MLANAPSRLKLTGGTHNPLAPPFEFLQAAYLPLLTAMGPQVELTLERTGFYPAGGGHLTAEIHPVQQLLPLWCEERGTEIGRRAVARLSRLPRHIAERELEVIARAFHIDNRHLEILEETSTNMAIIERFTGLRFDSNQLDARRWHITLGGDQHG